jgi:hypothetical protein
MTKIEPITMKIEAIMKKAINLVTMEIGMPMAHLNMTINGQATMTVGIMTRAVDQTMTNHGGVMGMTESVIGADMMKNTIVPTLRTVTLKVLVGKMIVDGITTGQVHRAQTIGKTLVMMEGIRGRKISARMTSVTIAVKMVTTLN